MAETAHVTAQASIGQTRSQIVAIEIERKDIQTIDYTNCLKLYPCASVRAVTEK